MSSYPKQMQKIFDDYVAAGMPMPASLEGIYEWATETGRWKPQAHLARRKFTEDMGRALREHYTTDSHGYRVRVNHPVAKRENGIVLHLWDDAYRAEHPYMELAFAQRRNGILADNVQLKRDRDWYKEIRPENPQIEISFDFTRDIAEMEALAELRASKRREAKTSSSEPPPPAEQSPFVVPPSKPRPVPSRPASRRRSRV